MRIQVFHRLLLLDPRGKIINDSGRIPSRSYVIQFLELIEAFLDGPTTKNATDVDNAESPIYRGATGAPVSYGRVDASANLDTHGIVVGTNDGATPEGNENYKLDTKVLHGSGVAGKLNHQAVTMVAPAVVGANVDFDISRPFINDSGGTITIKEAGIICKNSQDTKYHLLVRDVVSDFAVPDDYTLTVVYTLRTTV